MKNALASTPKLAMIGMRLIDYLLNHEISQSKNSIYNTALDFVIKTIFRLFVPLGRRGESHYCDLWWKALPTDDKVPVDSTMKMVRSPNISINTYGFAIISLLDFLFVLNINQT